MRYRLTIINITDSSLTSVYETGDAKDIYLALRNNNFPNIDAILVLLNDYRVCEIWKDLDTKAVLERFL